MKKEIFNPYLPMGEYVPDGEPHLFDGRIYIYGSHDCFGSKKYCANDYICYSASEDNLTEWINHGIIYKKTDDPYERDGKSCLWAPDVERGVDGRYYLYYCYAFKPYIGVAVADKPAGPFSFYGHVHYEDGTDFGARKNDYTPFDPAILVDDDGKIFLYTGFAPGNILPMKGKHQHDGCYCLELEADMLTVKRTQLVLPDVNHSKGTGFEGHEFFEASSIRKFNNLYYLVYSSILNHELCYAVSERPDKDFCFKGILVSNGDIGYQNRKKEDALYYTANNHGGIVFCKDQYYIFYHRHTNYGQTCRQGCAEKLTMNEKGLFEQVEITSCGLNDGPLNGKGKYPAYIACNLSSKNGCILYPLFIPPFLRKKEHPYITQDEIDGSEKSEQYVKNMRDGAWAGYKYFELLNTRQITLEISGESSGTIEILTDLQGEAITTINLAGTGNSRRKLTASFSPKKEKSAVYFRFTGTGSINLYGFELQ